VPAELTAERFVADLVPFVPAGLGEEFESVASVLDDGMGNGDAIRADIRTGPCSVWRRSTSTCRRTKS
jgi:hypothetical protein